MLIKLSHVMQQHSINSLRIIYIDFPTHIHGNILDLIITREESTLTNNYNCSTILSITTR